MAIAAVLVLLLAARSGPAPEPVFSFLIPLQPRTTALLMLGRQAHVSLGLRDGVRCEGFAAAVDRLTIAQALHRLLDGSRCEAVFVDPGTILIVRRPPPPLPTPAKFAAPMNAPVSVDEVIVTAEKRPEFVSRAASDLSVLPTEIILSHGAADASALVGLTAGITVTNLGPGRDKILVRGLSDGPLTGRTQSTVGIYLDDLRLTYNAPDPDLRWTDIAQVEVLRGPQGSLYGAGSIGGVIHVVTNAPDPSAAAGEITTSGTLTARGEPSDTLEGFVNQPLGGGAALRIAGWLESDGGYIRNAGSGGSDVNATRRDGFRASVLWEPRADLSWRATLINQSIYTGDAQYAEPSVGPLARTTAAAEPHDNDFRSLDVSVRWRRRSTELTGNLGLIEHDVVSQYDASAAPASLTAGVMQPAAYREDNHIRALVAEARITSAPQDRFTWLAGAFATFGEQELSSRVLGEDSTGGYAEVRRDQLLEAALFGEATLEFLPKMSMTLGGRLFASRGRVRSGVTPTDGPAFAGRATDSGFAPKVKVTYHASSAWTVYVEAAEGYRAPGLNTGGGPLQTFGGSAGGQPRRLYSSDDLWSFEGGARYSALSGRLRAHAAAFYAVWRDIQSDLLLPSGLPFTANLGDGQTVGFEAEAALVAGGATVGVNGVVEEPELDRPDPGFPLRADAALAGVPRRSFGVHAEYRVSLPGGGAAGVSGRANYVGASRLTFDASTSVPMGDYVDSHAEIWMAKGRLKLTAFVDNLCDTRGDTFAYGNPFTLRTTAQTTPQRPRTIGIRLTRDF